MNKSEKKYFNTAKKMNDALLVLLDKKDFTDITIKELCDTAKINRTTFYLHYSNLNDLLLETHSNIINELFSSYDDIDLNVDELPSQKSIFINSNYLKPFLQFVKSNQKIFCICVNNPIIFSSEQSYIKLLNNVIAPVYKKYGIADDIYIKYSSKYYLRGIMGILTEWANNGCKESIDFIIDIIIKHTIIDTYK